MADSGSASDSRPHIVIVAGRGEVLRNFLFSDTLSYLAKSARVTVLSVVDGDAFVRHFSARPERVVRLREYPQPTLVAYLRVLIENAHDRWQWSAVARNNWERRDLRAKERRRVWRRRFVKVVSWFLSFRPILRGLTAVKEELAYRLRPTRDFDELFEELQPDLVFNGSQIHGIAAELPMRVARRMGIPTAVFVFSWDNLTSQTRIFVTYDLYFVWTESIRQEFLRLYPHVEQDRVIATGTPQFDYHFRPENRLEREELCQRLGIDPARPYVLYTAGIDHHFFEEHLHVRRVAELLAGLDLPLRPQLVVRTYTKGTSDEMKALAAEGLPDVIFPPVTWDAEWQTPKYEDLEIYTSLLKHAALGINAASTVSLELMVFDKPIINIRYDPPGSDLPWCLGFERHILFDHYWPVAQSGATMVAESDDDMRRMLKRGLERPDADAEARRTFVASFFGDLLDGRAGERIGRLLLDRAQRESQ